MTTIYELERDNLLRQLDEIENDSGIQDALSKTLPNDGDDTDYDAWLKGTMRFMRDNEKVLKTLVK